MRDISKFFVDLYSWLKMNDLPNWMVVIISLLLWPAILYFVVWWWSRRKVRHIPNLRVAVAKGQIKVGDNVYNAVDIVFSNNTDSVVYIRKVKNIQYFTSTFGCNAK
jgi:hypothetical protein